MNQLNFDLNKLPEAFYTTKKNHTGLGLTLVQSIVDQHQGNLTLNVADNIFSLIMKINENMLF